MIPLKQIRKGILEGDMDMVALGYKCLTGEDLNKQEEKLSKEEEKEKDSSNFLSSSMEDFIVPSKKEDAETSSDKMAKSRPISLEKRENQFVDDGSEHKDISTPDTALTPRQRTTFKMISQKCEKCDQTYEVHPIHKREHYICDRCVPK